MIERRTKIFLLLVGVTLAILAIMSFFLPPDLEVRYNSWGTLGSVHLEGTVYNHGTRNYVGVRLQVRLVSSTGASRYEFVDIGDLPAGTSKDFNVDINHSFLSIQKTEVSVLYASAG